MNFSMIIQNQNMVKKKKLCYMNTDSFLVYMIRLMKDELGKKFLIKFIEWRAKS